MKFHILGVAHSIANKEYPTDPFTNKSVIMSRMLTEAGHEVIYYGVEGGSVICTHFEEVVSLNTFNKTYPTVEHTRKNAFKGAEGPAWGEFIKNSVEKINKNTVNNREEFLLCFFGIHHKPIAAKTNLIVVEPGIGYLGTFATYRIFESYAWMHYMYGREDRMWPHSYDCVIPNFYYTKDHVYSDKKDDYFMFMGRIAWGKGLSVAAELSVHFDKPLIVCGSGDLRSALSERGGSANIIYKGVVNFEEKTKLLSKASCFICPSLYVEPFGHVVPEALLAGTPVITTDYGSFTELVIHGKTGFRCSIFNDYLQAIQNLKHIKSEDCRYYAETNFSVEAVLSKYENYFHRLLAVNNSGNGWYSTK